jgi:uncharacterized membrane protein HdeD (DUF308 family)
MLAAGIATLALAGFALLLPIIRLPSGWVVGWLLLVAGGIELLAGLARHSRSRREGIIAGGVTTLAGLLFVTDPLVGLYPVSYVVMGWLFVRSAVLLVTGFQASGGLRTWALLGGFGDLILGVILLFGLPVAALILSAFGSTPELVASFALILAISFLITGIGLMSLAAAERRQRISPLVP